MDTSKVILYKDKKPTYFLPGYLRIKTKNFVQMSLQDLSAVMNATIIFTVYYGSINDKKIIQSLQSQVVLLFQRDQAIKLNGQESIQTTINLDQDKQMITYTLRKTFNLRIQSDVFWTPFQVIYLVLAITVQPITTEQFVIKINLMDHKSKLLKVSYSDQGSFGNYNLARSQMRAQYSNIRVFKTQHSKSHQQIRSKQSQKMLKINQKSKIQHFQYGHFCVPLYKFPYVSLATIFLPLWLLAIINLGIFFQESDFNNRIASIASILISFVALIPTIRDQIPPSPKIVFIQIIVYIETFTTLLCFIQSLNIKNIVGFQEDWTQDGLFLASFILTIISVIIILTMTIFHIFSWEPNYLKENQNQKDIKFKRTQWKNPFCDQYFNKLAEKGFKLQQFK